MTREASTDPEILADLHLRAASERDPSRTRGANYDWQPAAIAEVWPCRGCGAPVGMPREAIDAAKACNRKLVATGERPFSKRELAVCEPCRALEREAERARESRRSETIAALTRELRHGVTPWREAAIADELRALGADARELIRRVAAERAQSTTTTTTRRKSL